MADVLPLTAAYAEATGSMMPQEVATPLPEPSGTCITGSWQQRCQSGRDSSPCRRVHVQKESVEGGLAVGQAGRAGKQACWQTINICRVRTSVLTCMRAACMASC